MIFWNQKLRVTVFLISCNVDFDNIYIAKFLEFSQYDIMEHNKKLTVSSRIAIQKFDKTGAVSCFG